MDHVRRWREPLALILLIAGGLRLLVGIVAVPLTSDNDNGYGSVADAAMWGSSRTFDVTLLVAIAVVAIWCAAPPAAARAVPILIAAVIETSLGVLISLGFGLLGLASHWVGRGVELAYLLLGLVVPVLAVVGLLLTLRPFLAGQGARPPSTGTTGPVGPEPTVVGAPPVVPPVPPVWQPEQATGRVWHRAGDAARGEPGAGWASQGGSGWQPIPGAGQGPGHSTGEQPRPEHPTP